MTPVFVASPGSTEEASALLRAAAGYGLTVVPRGAGTGLSWGAPPSACDLVVDMRRMDQVIEHAAGDLVARVQAGVTIGQLAVALGAAGQQLALDAPAEATVGGVVATGTAGPRRFRYGAPRDLLIGLTVARADGVIAHSGGKVVKNVAGYDIGKLFCGSQGTLGLITEATFRLHPLPAAVTWVTAGFEPGQRAGVVTAVASAAGSALVPSAVELDWPGGPQRPLRVGVLLEGTPSGVAERAGQMSELLASAGGSAGVSETATTGVPPAAASSSALCLARSLTPDGVPSSSTPTRSTTGGPVHSSSTADGTSAEPAADATAAAAPARSDGPKSPVTQASAAGRGCSRNVASVIRPSVPCEPENSLPRS